MRVAEGLLHTSCVLPAGVMTYRMFAMSRGAKVAYLSFISLLIFGAVIYYLSNKEEQSPASGNPQPRVEEVVEPEEVYQDITSRLLVVGDIFWGRHIELLAEQSADPVNHPFRGLDTLEREKYDTWIANVECPITNNVVPYHTQIDTLIFNCPPKFLEGFSKYFDVISLANNHTDNQGVEGLAESRQHIENAGLQHFGHYDNSVTDDLCDVTTIDAKLGGEQVKFPIAMCGFHGVFNTPTLEQISAMEKYAEKFITIAMPHSGAEYKPAADELKIENFRAMADAGADVVIGGHPHWVQDSEVYDEKLIVYSLGNFIFDQNFNADVSRGIGVDLSLEILGGDQTQEWLNMAADCTSWKDDCLDQAEGLEKPEFGMEFDLVGVESNGYLTTKATEPTYQSLLERTKWQGSMEELRQTD